MSMTNLITEARELCEYSEKIVNQLHTERLDYELEYMPLIETIQVTSELCDALEKAERESGCVYCINSPEKITSKKERYSHATETGIAYDNIKVNFCPNCGKRLEERYETD